jgi:hypothetical protein
MVQNRRGSFTDVNGLFVFGAFTVLVIHILGFFIAASQDFPGNYDAQALSIILLRFGRALFIFGTGLLMFYWYANREVDWRKFWRKRWINVLVPYLIWTGIYTCVRFQTLQPEIIVPEFLKSVLTGSAFYHLYYIPLYLQLNVLFMLFKRVIEQRLRFVWVLLVFAAQAALYACYRYVFVTPGVPIDWNASAVMSFLQEIYNYGQNYAFMYVFYFLLGCYAGLNIDKWRIWVYRFRYVSLLLFIGFTAVIAGSYLTDRISYEEGLNIFSPLYLTYTTSFILASYPFLAHLGRLPVISGWLAKLAKYNMALYLVHPMILFLLESYVIYRLPWSTPALIAAMFLVTVPASIFLYQQTSIAFWLQRKQKRSKPQTATVRSYQT